jgi:hypothetical protein
MYRNQNISVCFNNVKSGSFKVENGVRQGAILSPLFFNVYINDTLNKISNSKIGCKLGISYSNIIAYADDVTLLAPSRIALQLLINMFKNYIGEIKLEINTKKSCIMIFKSNKSKLNYKCNFYIDDSKLSITDRFEYLGFIITDDLSDKEDIIKCRNKFYYAFNSLLRKFSTSHVSVFTQLFKSYCSNFYGSQTWSHIKGCSKHIKQFEVGYHKAIKKILKVPFYYSNHYVCDFIDFFTFRHKINFDVIQTVHRLLNKPCTYVFKNINFFHSKSSIVKMANKLWYEKYNVTDSAIEDNDIDAIKSRISFIQANEPSSAGRNFM